MQARVIEVNAFPVDDDSAERAFVRPMAKPIPVKSNSYRTVKKIYVNDTRSRNDRYTDIFKRPVSDSYRPTLSTPSNRYGRSIPGGSRTPRGIIYERPTPVSSIYERPPPNRTGLPRRMNLHTNILLNKWLKIGKISCLKEGLDKLHCKKCQGKFHVAEDCGLINDNDVNTNILLNRWLLDGKISCIKEGLDRIRCRKCQRRYHVASDCRFEADDSASDSASEISEVSIKTPFEDQTTSAQHVAISLQQALSALDFYKNNPPPTLFSPNFKLTEAFTTKTESTFFSNFPSIPYVQKEAGTYTSIRQSNLAVQTDVDLTADDDHYSRLLSSSSAHF